MGSYTKHLLAASIVFNLLLLAFIYFRHQYERGWTASLAGNCRAISAVADAYFLANPNVKYVRYSELKEWDTTEWLKKNEQPEIIYQPIIAQGDDRVMILFAGRYGIIGVNH